MNAKRPLPDASCENFDKYKYGLADGFPGYALGNVNDIGSTGVVDRYLGRQIHYTWGLVSFYYGQCARANQDPRRTMEMAILAAKQW